MKCIEANNLLQEYIDDALSPAEQEKIAEHHQQCPACAERYLAALGIIRMLKTVDVVSPRPGFTSRVLDHATEGPDSKNRTGILSNLPASAIAASVAILAVVSLVWTLLPTPAAQVIRLEGNEIRVVKVAIDSTHQIDNVKMTIGVSENLEISGYENVKNISWEASLNPGINVISLPVLALKQGNGVITAEVKLAEKIKHFRIQTEAEWPDNVMRKNAAQLGA